MPYPRGALPHALRAFLGLFVLAFLGPSGCGDESRPAAPDTDGQPDATPPPDLEVASGDAGGPPRDTGRGAEVEGAGEALAVSLETSLPVEEVQAGTPVRVTCRALDAEGDEVRGVPTAFLVHPATGYLPGGEPDTFVPTAATTFLVACQSPSTGLLDPTPATLRVTPGPPATVIATLDGEEVVAGETVLVSCDAFDAFGNPVDVPPPEVAAEPDGDGVTEGPPAGPLGPRPVTITRAGFYRLTCDVEGVRIRVPAALRVHPALPAHLAVGVSPLRPLYRAGEVVTLNAAVTDRFDNPVPGARIRKTSIPETTTFGFDRFRLDRDGRYTLTATVLSETEGDIPLSASLEIEVSTVGPDIACLTPADGQAVNHPPGTDLLLVGQVSDPNGVGRVLVGGRETALDQDGRFTVPVATRFGMNFVEVVAEDARGMASSTFCGFLVADHYAPQDLFLQDAVSFRMGQAAIDDGLPDAPLTSLADILRRMLNSVGLVATVDAMMLAANPLHDNCEWNCPWPFNGRCCMRVRVDYRGGTFRLPGPNTLAATLVDGGLAVSVTLVDPEVGFHAETSISRHTGTVRTDWITVGMVFDAGLGPDGRPEVRLRPGTETSDVGPLHYEGGWEEVVVRIVLSLFDGYFRNQIATAIRNQLRDNVDSILDGVFRDLDITALGREFQVPSLVGGAPATIGVGVGFSRMDFNPARALFGFGLRLTGPSARPGDPVGAAIPPGPVLLDPGGDRTLGVAVSLGVLNQALYTLWRAGYLDFDAEAFLPGLENAPPGSDLSLHVSLPPTAARGDGEGRLRIGLAGARMRLRYPGLFDEPVEVRLGAEASAGVVLVGERDIEFQAVTVDRILFITPNVNLEPVTRAILEEMLRRIVQTILDRTVNGALPVLPIPEFPLPASLSQYGIPEGTVLGLRQPLLAIGEGHFLVQGNFGE